MRYWKKFHSLSLFLLLWCGLLSPLSAQELNFNVRVNAEAIQANDPQVFEDMQNTIREFINSRSWTEDRFESRERIFGNLIINIQSSPGIGQYKATVQIQSSRPVYGSSYETLLFNYLDKDWVFEYTPSQPLDYNENAFSNNLTSMLAFYAYLVIGLDYDSFALMGGTPYFRQANDIAQNAQQENISGSGWLRFESNQNRFWLIQNINNQRNLPIREALYTYHRKGLDMFASKPEEARENITLSIRSISQVAKNQPNALFVRTFFDAKRREIVNIFSKGDMQKRKEVYNMLVEMDPTHREDYDEIINE